MKKTNIYSAYLSAAGIALSATLSVGFVNVTPKVIYGTDNRHEVYEEANPAVRENADSTVVFIHSSKINIANGIATIRSLTLEKEMRVCSSEPYAQQPAVGNCSGSLVGDDLIATAGHCVGATDCRGYNVVFGYRMESSNVAVTTMPESEIYSCKTVIAREYTNNQDYALVQLDRPVKGHRVLPLAKASVQAGDDIYVIGHPSGLPTKIADGAKVRTLMTGFFRTNLDTYGGNSGSAVFSAATHEVVGILVRGETDFKYADNNQCRVSNVCEEEGCRGEDVTNISYISQAIQNR